MSRLAALVVLLSGLAFAGEPPIVLGVGQMKRLEFAALKNVALRDPDIADVKAVDGKELLVIGLAPGVTFLKTWEGDATVARDFKVQVVEAAQAPDAGVEAAPAVTLTKTLKVKQRVSQPVAKLVRASVGDAKVCDLSLSSKKDAVVLTGLAPGKTSVLLWFDGGRLEQWKLEVTK